MLQDFVMSFEHLLLLLKEGEKGSTIISKDSITHQKAFNNHEYPQLKVIDTTGAGDTFTAAYAVTRDLKFATAAAFLCVTRKGAA